jgi:hypothetical protein
MKKLFTLFLVLFLALSFSCGGSHDGEEELNLTDAQKEELPVILFSFLMANISDPGDACDSFEMEGDDPPESVTYENCVVTEVYEGEIDCGDLTISGSFDIDETSEDVYRVTGELSFSHTILFPETTTCDVDINYNSEGASVQITGTVCEESIDFTVEDEEASNIINPSDICSVVL